MRHQDELLRALAATTAVETRRYVIRQMGDLPLAADFDDVVAALAREEAAGGPLAPLASTVLGVQRPRWLARRHGLVAEVEPSDAWMSAGSHLLEGCLEPLAAAAASPDPATRAAALRGLARYLHHGARKMLEKLARESHDAAIALASTGDPDALPAVLERLRAPTAPRAELVRHLERYPSPETVREVRAALRAPEPDLRIAAAIALQGFGEHDPLALARPMLTSWDERWPLVHLVDSLGRTALREAVPDLVRLHGASRDPLVRIAAVRSAINLGGPQAVDLAQSVLKSGAEPEQAVVLEGLAQVGLKVEDLRARLAELAESEHGKLALDASIALAGVDPGASTKRAVAWLRSDDEDVRRQGAYLLGFLPSELARKVATKIASADPSPAVRSELMRALAKYPPALAGPALAGCLAQDDPQVSARAIRLRAEAGDLKPAELAAQLVALLSREREPGVRIEALAQIGLAAAPDDAIDDALAAEMRAEDPRIAVAAANALGATGRERLASRFAGLPDHAGAELRAAVAVARFALADSGWPDALRILLTAGQEEIAAGARALEEVLMLVPRLPASPRHDGLRQHLTDHLRAPGYQAFARERLALPARPAAARGFADVQSVGSAPVRDVDMTQSTANLLIGLDPNPSRVPREASMLSGRFPRPRVESARTPAPAPEGGAGWSGKQTVAALLIVTCATGFLVVRELRKPKPPPVTGPSAIAPGVLAGLEVLSVEGKATVAKGQSLKPPVTVSTEVDARVTVASRVRQNRVTLGPESRVTFASLEVGAKPSAYALRLSEASGALQVSSSFGEPHLRIDLADAAVEAGRVVLRVEVSAKSTAVKVQWNEATVRAGARTVRVKEGEALVWERGQPPGDPKAVDMSKDVWK